MGSKLPVNVESHYSRGNLQTVVSQLLETERELA